MKVKRILGMVLVLVVVFSFACPLFASAAEPRSGEECPYCGVEYRYETTYTAWQTQSTSSCVHGGGSASLMYNDVLQTRRCITSVTCPECMRGRTEESTESRTYCPYTRRYYTNAVLLPM